MLARFTDVVLLIPRRTQKRLHGLPDVVCLRGPRRGFMGSQTNPDAVAWVISMGISDGQRRRAADLSEYV